MTRQYRSLPDTGWLTHDDAKERLRSVLRSHRARQPHPSHGHNERCHHFAEHALLAIGSADTVACYVSVGNEPCTRLLLEQLEAEQRRVLLPVLGPGLSRSWGYFRGIADLSERAPGRPPEPSGEALEAEAIAEAGTIIVPALAVDRHGHRLGQGGGWYDRVLPLRNPNAEVFAMVYADELVNQDLPIQHHDQPIDAVVTEHEFFLIEGSVFSSAVKPASSLT
ncbi:5-formyltetrahydrofolate cyclo-ligase [Actinomyces vulturis]|uniref:5-formyltetrahydrofolate cyclo-ligase n=1 Tax=Actinomyces vulturis TaxID=1857645 RepID=UPI000831FEE8|nr:5-formyltetrahydrofolate cyclo-ligase [Actinomyces vulturis]